MSGRGGGGLHAIDDGKQAAIVTPGSEVELGGHQLPRPVRHIWPINGASQCLIKVGFGASNFTSWCCDISATPTLL
jgi:hypothetical protein